MTDPQEPDTSHHDGSGAGPGDTADSSSEDSSSRTRPLAGRPSPGTPDHWASELFDE
jgi:hypothetical protein